MSSELPHSDNDKSALMDFPIGRRRFAKWLAASLVLSGYRHGDLVAMPEDAQIAVTPPNKLKVAAVQMTPKLGDVEANLA